MTKPRSKYIYDRRRRISADIPFELQQENICAACLEWYWVEKKYLNVYCPDCHRWIARESAKQSERRKRLSKKKRQENLRKASRITSLRQRVRKLGPDKGYVKLYEAICKVYPDFNELAEDLKWLIENGPPSVRYQSINLIASIVSNASQGEKNLSKKE